MNKAHFVIYVGITLLASASGQAQIVYDANFDATNGKLLLSVAVPVKSDVTSVQIPNWAPGAYILANYRDRILDMTAKDGNGNKLEITKPDANTWSVSSKGLRAVKFDYAVSLSMIDNVVHYSGPSTYVYVLGRKEEKCILRLSPPGKGMVAIGLDADKKEKNTYTAKTYDILADNPVTMGDFVLDTYTYRGKVHEIAYRGAATKFVNRAEVIRVLEFLTKAQIDFFRGQMPYSKYVWHFSVNDAPDGAGGLEHLSSTQIGMAAGAGPGVQHVWSHEFFHLWNVKRIRSFVLGPFDYLQLPKTGALWWLEGATDYYSNIIPMRYGLWNEQKFLEDLLDNYNGAMRNNGRKEISIYDSSLRVGEANNGRGNSNGLKISYYTFGWLAGMCLDTEIRFRTDGKKSLDDVMWILWNMCKDDKPGFQEDAIRNACIKIGGPSLAEFFDRVVMTPGDPPIPEQLAKMGLAIQQVKEKFADKGFDWTPARGDGGARVTAVRAGAEGVLQRGDIVIEFDGVNLVSESNALTFAAISKANKLVTSGKSISLKFKRGDETKSATIVATESERELQRIVEVAGATEAQRKLRNGWYYAGKKKIELSLAAKNVNGNEKRKAANKR